MKRLSAVFSTVFALAAISATLASDERPFVKAAGRITGAYQDSVDEMFVFLVLEREGSFTYAYIQTNDTTSVLKDIQPYIGREVTISGREETPTITHRIVTHRQIAVPSLAAIELAHDEVDDPFDVPSLDSAPPSLSEMSSPSPRTTTGTVAARWQNKSILRKADGESIIVAFREGIPFPDIGDTIQAAGFPVTDLYRIHLDAAVWKKSAATPIKQIEPVDMPLDKLFRYSGVFIMNTREFGQTLRIKGTLKEFVADENGDKLLLLEDKGLTIQIDCSNAPDALKIQRGSVVSATGVCVLDSEIWRPTAPFPKNKRLFLVARGPGDIAVIKRPSWWTPKKLFIAILMLLGIILAILIWNAALRTLVRRRTLEAIKAQERKLESEFRVAERTRLAADLHDSFSQNLSVIGYHVAALQTSLAGRDEDVSVSLSTVAKMIKSCLADLRRCLWDLRNDVLDEPDFTEAIRRTIEPVARDARTQIRFDGRRPRLSDATAHALLNILRELVSNAVVHGKAKNIRIDGGVETDGTSISVSDDGCGFDPVKRPGTGEGHFGIDGIKARLERIDGIFELESAPGKGTKATITIKAKGHQKQ